MKLLTVLASIGIFVGIALSKDGDAADAGKKAEQRSCSPCHSLRLVDSQRLSRAAWQKEIDKMIGWGAVISDKQLLLDYLSSQYSNTQPPPSPVLSADSK
jgi:mono/diheme cytochrome c family protein